MRTLFSRLLRAFLHGLLLFAALVAPAQAQTDVVTTLMVRRSDGDAGAKVFNTDRPIRFDFSASALPPGALVRSATLQMVADDAMPSSRAQSEVSIEIQVSTDRQREPSKGSLAALTLYRNEPAPSGPDRRRYARWPLRMEGPLESLGGGPLSLQLTLQKTNDVTGQTRQWHSEQADDPRHRPRLVLTYTLPGSPLPGQALGLAGTTSPATFYPTVSSSESSDTKVFLRPYADVTGWRSQAPAFAHGLVYIVRGDDHNAWLEARGPLNGEVVWVRPLGVAGEHLLASAAGRLYVVGNEGIHAYRVDPGNPAAQPAPVQSPDGSSMGFLRVPGLKPQVAPAVGPDGSLFIVNDGKLVAYNPDLQLLWSLDLGNEATVTRISPLTVGPSGHFLYLVGASKGLLAVDATTGELRRAALSNQDLLLAFDKPDLRAPVVTRYSDGTELIWVSANTGTGGVVNLFSNPSTAAAPPAGTANDESASRLQSIWKGEGAWSQLLPQPGAGPVSVMGLRRYPGDNNRMKFAVEALVVQAGPRTDATAVVSPTARGGGDAPEIDPDVWAPVGRPVVDSAGGLLVWNNQRNTLQIYRPAGLIALPATSPFFESTPRLMFGSDGTLYAYDESRRALHVAWPEVQLRGQFRTRVHSPTHLRLSGYTGTETDLSSAGSILLAPGTQLNAGTRLRAGQPAQPQQ